MLANSVFKGATSRRTFTAGVSLIALTSTIRSAVAYQPKAATPQILKNFEPLPTDVPIPELRLQDAEGGETSTRAILGTSYLQRRYWSVE
jgi:hypothetical protein